MASSHQTTLNHKPCDISPCLYEYDVIRAVTPASIYLENMQLYYNNNNSFCLMWLWFVFLVCYFLVYLNATSLVDIRCYIISKISIRLLTSICRAFFVTCTLASCALKTISLRMLLSDNPTNTMNANDWMFIFYLITPLWGFKWFKKSRTSRTFISFIRVYLQDFMKIWVVVFEGI